MAHERRIAPLNPFSPWKSKARSLQQTIVGRDFVVTNILDKTQRFALGAPAKHCLLIGRRGLGKTHALALLYHYFEGNCTSPGHEALPAHLLPVILLEEERFSLNSLALLLLKIFEKFSERKTEGRNWEIPELVETDDDVIQYCFEFLMELSQDAGKKIIILCDNLEEVFKQWGSVDYKKLRKYLSDQRAVMIIGTAVRVFEEIVSPKQPFYEFFERVPLVDLTDEQMLEVLEKRFIEDNLEDEFQRKKSHLRNKLAAITTLTGGNPRLVVFLYDIVTKKNVFEIENATEELMESLNEYFRNRFAELSPQEKNILDAFAEMDGPATTKEIAKKTRIKEQSTRVNIQRLKDAGYIYFVEYGRHRAKRYDVTERLFRLWRQNASISGRKKFQILIRFLKLYFTPEELKEDFHWSIKQLDASLRKMDLENAAETVHYLSYLQQVAEGDLKVDIFDKRTDALLKMGDHKKVEEEILFFTSEVATGENVNLKAIYWKLIEIYLRHGKYGDAENVMAQMIKSPTLGEEEEYLNALSEMTKKCPEDGLSGFGDFIENVNEMNTIFDEAVAKEFKIDFIAEIMFIFIESFFMTGKIWIANALYMNLVRKAEWHAVNRVQQVIAIHLRNLVALEDRELFINSVALAREHIANKDLLELLKAFLYAGRYMQEGDKIILEEIFPEIRDIVFDIVETFAKKNDE